MARLCAPPAAIAIRFVSPGVTLSCPDEFAPQPTTEPLARSARLCMLPAAMATTSRPEAAAGTVHWPKVSCPQATTVPLLRRVRLKSPEAAIATTSVARAFPELWLWSFLPQAATVPSARNATLCA